MRKGEQARNEMVKRMLVVKYCVMAVYFEQVQHVAYVREANIDDFANWRMPVLGDLNESGE